MVMIISDYNESKGHYLPHISSIGTDILLKMTIKDNMLTTIVACYRCWIAVAEKDDFRSSVVPFPLAKNIPYPQRLY
jgi:hypothetical protein